MTKFLLTILKYTSKETGTMHAMYALPSCNSHYLPFLFHHSPFLISSSAPILGYYNAIVSLCFFSFLSTLCFSEHFQVHTKTEGKIQRLPYNPWPLYTPPPHINTPDPSGTFVQRAMNLHQHIFITQSPQFTLGLSLGVVHSMGLDKCRMTCNCSPFKCHGV